MAPRMWLALLIHSCSTREAQHAPTPTRARLDQTATRVLAIETTALTSRSCLSKAVLPYPIGSLSPASRCTAVLLWVQAWLASSKDRAEAALKAHRQTRRTAESSSILHHPQFFALPLASSFLSLRLSSLLASPSLSLSLVLIIPGVSFWVILFQVFRDSFIAQILL